MRAVSSRGAGDRSRPGAPDTRPSPEPTRTYHAAPRPGPWADSRRVWGVVFAAALLDVVLTLYGLRLGFVEANPVADAVLRAVGPVLGLVGLKLLAVGVVALGSRRLSPRLRPSPAALLAAVWACAAAYNGWLLLRVTP